jgi:hypothetical protein
MKLLNYVISSFKVIFLNNKKLILYYDIYFINQKYIQLKFLYYMKSFLIFFKKLSNNFKLLFLIILVF